MSHLDDESVALAALGEPLNAVDDRHLQGCQHCQVELNSLRRVVDRVEISNGLVAPPASVWLGIAAATGVDPAGLSRLSNAAPVPLEPVASGLAEPALAPVASDLAEPTLDDAHNVTAIDRHALERRRRPRLRAGLLVAAAVGGVIVGVGATLGWQILSHDDFVLASASLEPLPGYGAAGTVSLVETAFGREVEMEMADQVEVPPHHHLEVWLLSADTEHMVSIGVVDGSTAHWALPAGVTFSAYPIVDVSVEPDDGNPAHSGESAVRGTLHAATAPGSEL